MNRFYYALRQGLRYRFVLTQINAQRCLLQQIPFKKLIEQGNKVIVFDFDGVLAPYGSTKPDDMGQQLIERALTHFNHVYILSNKPTQLRQAYFKEHYPAIKFMIARRKKPFSDGLDDIIHETQVIPAAICLVDDRLLTGALACVITGVTPLLVADPRIDYSNHFVIECANQALRYIERCLFRGTS